MIASFLFAVLLLSAGFAKLLAICVNWLCSHRLPKKIVAIDKILNLGLLVTYPILLIYGLGWTGPHLLRGGCPLEIPSVWWLPIGMGAGGFLLLVRSTIGYWSYRPPVCEVSVDHQRVDLRVEYGDRWRDVLVHERGHSAHQRIAQFPRNEQFMIDVSSKTYELPRVSVDWDGLSIVHLSDFHFYHGVSRVYFEEVCQRAAALEPDLFLFTGDLLDDMQRVEWLPETLGRLKGALGQYFILGNHDWYLDHSVTRREMERLGWTDLSSRVTTLSPSGNPAGSPLILCGDETPWMGTHPDLSSAPPEAFRILLSHTPDNITWAQNQQIDLMLAGHTHGGQIRLPMLGPIYSPSRFGCTYSAGVFWRNPTLLYVSRGVSGREPIRYDCPPEVTKLILRRTVDAAASSGKSAATA